MKELTVRRNDAGQRLDRFVGKAVPLLPETLAAMRHVVNADAKKIFSFTLDEPSNERFCTACEEYTLAPVRGGTQTSVSLAAGESFFYPVTAGEELLVSARLPEELTAPLTAGQAVGELIVSFRSRSQACGPHCPYSRS